MNQKTTIFLFLLPFMLRGQNNIGYAVLTIPAELLKGANAVIREHREDFIVKSAGEATLREFRAVTLFNDKSSYDQLSVYYNSFNKLGKIKGKIYDALGQLVREIDKKEIKDLSAISGASIYEDSRLRFIDVNYADYPYTVEFEYEMFFTELLDYPNWSVMGFHTALENATFTIELPAGLQVHYKPLNLNVAPEETPAGKGRRLSWDMKALPAVKREPYSPSASELLPRLLLSPQAFKAGGYLGSMASWNEFGVFMNMLIKDKDQLSPAMKTKVAELTAGAGSDREKIAALYGYLQQNMRYVSVQLGIGGWQPFDAGYVEANKYGDCKALSNFMKAMLKEAGITSYPALIYGGDLDYEVTEDFATPRFNHMILHVPSESYWLECTSNDAPVNYLGSFTAGRNVLLVTETGGKLARTPDLPPAANSESNEIAVALQPSGSATVEVSSRLTGDKQEWYRAAAAHFSKEDLRKEFQEASSLPGFTLEGLSVAPEKDAPEAAVAFKAQVPHYGSKQGKRLFIPLNALNPFTTVPPANEQRLHPVLVREGYVEDDRAIFLLPEGYQVEAIPSADFSLETSYGRYSAKTTKEEGKIIFERHLEILPVRLPAGDYGAWRDFYKEIAKADGAKLVLVERKT